MKDLFMGNSQKKIESLFIGFFTNSLNKDELEQLWQWLDKDVSHRKEFDDLRSAWIMAGHNSGKQSFDIGQSWLAIEQRIKPARFMWFKHFNIRPLWYAASLIICFGLGAGMFLFTSQKKHAEHSAFITKTATTSIHVPMGSKTSVVLPDGSTVWLNADSEIHYSSVFGLENRDLHLTGEAFFDVISDSIKPFNVHAAGITVKAYGTRFNVKAYPDDLTLAATLEEGNIDVVIPSFSDGKSSSKSVKLRPKEQLVIYKVPNESKIATPSQGSDKKHIREIEVKKTVIKEVTIKPNVKTELLTSWKDPKWIISDEPLATFADNLERRYNVNISFASEELKEYNFSGIFENETIEQILTAMSLAAPVNYLFDKNNVVLSLNKKDQEKFKKILKNKK